MTRIFHTFPGFIAMAVFALIFAFCCPAMAKRARLYINAASVDGIRIETCGPITNHVAECKARVHFKDDMASVKPTTSTLKRDQITAESE